MGGRESLNLILVGIFKYIGKNLSKFYLPDAVNGRSFTYEFFCVQKHGILALMKRPPEGTGNPFETYEELIEQSLYSYGTVARSAIDRFFSVSCIHSLA